jgi:Na+/melibiose symporter-like transporter
VIWERHTRSPMLDVKVFANARFTAASMALTLTSFALAGTMFFLTQYLQLVLGYTPLQAGLCFIPLVLGLLVMASLSPVIARRTGVRATISGGLGIVVVSIALFAPLNADSSYVLVALILALLGAGLGLTMVTATNMIMGTLPLGKAGVGSAVNDTAQEVGGALGVAILGSVLAASYHAAINSAPAIQALPNTLKALVQDSIGSASVIASHLGGAARHSIVTAANTAFIDGMNHTALVAAGVSLCGLLVALFFLPAKTRDLTEPDSLTTMERQEEETTV